MEPSAAHPIPPLLLRKGMQVLAQQEDTCAPSLDLSWSVYQLMGYACPASQS